MLQDQVHIVQTNLTNIGSDSLSVNSIVLSNTVSETNENIDIYNSNLLIRYNFNGDLTDSSTNNVILTGTPGTFETENGKTSLKLNGDTSDPLFCNVDLTGNKTFSISLWFKKTSLLNNDTIVSTDKLHTYGGISLAFGNTDGVMVLVEVVEAEEAVLLIY